MKKSCLFAIVGTWGCSVLAQPSFEKIYLAGGAGKMNLIELSSHNILTSFSYSSVVNITGFSLIDSEGDILHTHCYAIDTLLVLQSVKKYTDRSEEHTSELQSRENLVCRPQL